MSSVLHPVGPEPAQTYWIRRAAVLSVAILVLAVVVALIINGTSSGSAVQAEPSPPPASPPTAAASSSASATPTAKKSPPAKTSTASPRATAKAKPSPKAVKTTKTTKTIKTRAPAPPACPAAQLRPTLTGKQQLKVKADNTFRLSLINGSGRTCVAEVTAENFELKIYSGNDRIWSTGDCSKAIKATRKTIKAEQALEWSLTWNGRRSRSDCKNRPETPKAGTYFATAQLDGAKPVQLRMILVD